MKQSLSDWEKYLHSNPDEPPLIQCALMHYQFETIHPFVDGNGCLGRLLITFFLCEKGFLSQPLLYLSEFFERYRDEYYRQLLDVSQKGNWRGWLEYFLQGVIEQSKNAMETARIILDTYEKYREMIHSEKKKMPRVVFRLIDEIFATPVISISALSRKWKVDYRSVRLGVLRLVALGVLKEVTNRKRNKLYVATELMEVLSSNPSTPHITI